LIKPIAKEKYEERFKNEVALSKKAFKLAKNYRAGNEAMTVFLPPSSANEKHESIFIRL